jgi:hypothetical protein
MLAIIIYYIVIYFSGSEYKIQYLSDNSLGFLSEDPTEIMTKDSIELYLAIKQLNFENGNIHLYLTKGKEDKIYNEMNLTKCEIDFGMGQKGELYCFNLSYYDTFYAECEGNCTDSLTGEPYTFEYDLFYNILKINHNKKYPFNLIKNNNAHTSIPISIKKKETVRTIFQFTSILYKTTNILKKDFQIYNENFVSNIQITNKNDLDDNMFFLITAEPTVQSSIYEREYKTLLDTFSELGGIYANLQTIFTFLLLFYSSYENNYQIVKNIIIKKNLYQNNVKNQTSLKNLNNKTKEFINIEKNFEKKKIKINSWEHYFCSIFNGHKQKKTMKILNLCNDLVEEYLSAENIIFNSILFERFYEDNPINVNETQNLKELENEMFENNNEMDFLLGIT